MYSMELEGSAVDFCDRCHGILLGRDAVTKAAGVPNLHGLYSEKSKDIRKTETKCPHCGYALFEWRILPENHGLAVDVCGKCSSIYLDRGEYPRIKKHLRSKQYSLSPRKRAASHSVGTDDGWQDPDCSGIQLFQFFTDLPIEIGVSQKILSPGVTVLVLINIILYAVSSFQGLGAWIDQYGLVPSDIAAGKGYVTLFSSMFLHGGIWHLAANMYFLFVAGDNVEDSFGTLWFLVSYIFFGLAASLLEVYGDPASIIPSIGASGAISGVIGSYLVLHPTRRFLYRFFYLAWLNVPLYLPAFFFFGIWFLLQVLFMSMGVPGIAWWAHIGGFVAGVICTLAIRLIGKIRPGP